MESLDILMVSTVDHEKALADFKNELSDLLNVNVHRIHVDIDDSHSHSTITQTLMITVRNKSSLTNDELDMIPFDYMEFPFSDTVIFYFHLGEASI